MYFFKRILRSYTSRSVPIGHEPVKGRVSKYEKRTRYVCVYLVEY